MNNPQSMNSDLYNSTNPLIHWMVINVGEGPTITVIVVLELALILILGSLCTLVYAAIFGWIGEKKVACPGCNRKVWATTYVRGHAEPTIHCQHCNYQGVENIPGQWRVTRFAK